MVNTLILLYGKRFTSFLNVKLVDIYTGTGKHDWENECCISGEPFQQEELEEMLSAAVDPEKGTILYKEYVSRMAVEEV